MASASDARGPHLPSAGATWFHRAMRARSLGLAFLVLLLASPASATPGPDSVVVVANASVPESVALAQRYAAARDVPQNRVCLLDLPDTEDITLADYTSLLLEPLRTCLDAGGVRDRVEAAVLMRGVPLRVDVPVPDGDGTELVSTAAALGLWESTLSDGTPILGQEPGMRATCGTVSCYAARWRNPYHGYPFEPGWSADIGGVHWRPLLVTMLHGRSYDDAARLLDSALMAEAGDVAPGEMLFMEGADPARGAQDFENAAVIAGLMDRGFTASSVPFDASLTGRTLSAFFTGTASLGETIEGNTFVPGSLVDNLTSYGAVPVNFHDTGETQVSIARWVAMGVAGVHGTVEEPLNNSFPHRSLMLEYVDGATLAEAYFAQMPFVYWRNLVLGDPMAAPYAKRPEVTITGVRDGDRLADAVPVHVEASDSTGLGVASIVLYLDGEEIARADGDVLDHCLAIGAGEGHQLLAVARVAMDPSDAHPYPPKGWAALSLDGEGGSTECAAPMPDAGTRDGGVNADASTGPSAPSGCGCRVASSGGSGAWLLASALVGLALRRRRIQRV